MSQNSDRFVATTQRTKLSQCHIRLFLFVVRHHLSISPDSDRFVATFKRTILLRMTLVHSCLAGYSHHLSHRTAIVFSLPSSVPNFLRVTPAYSCLACCDHHLSRRIATVLPPPSSASNVLHMTPVSFPHIFHMAASGVEACPERNTRRSMKFTQGHPTVQ